MDYCTLDDIKGHVPEKRLVEISDDLNPNSSGHIDESIVKKAIVESSNLINAYIGKRFKLPLPHVPSVLRMICVDLSIYNLYERVTELDITEGMKLRYNNAIALLKRIADGEVSIGVKSEEEGVSETGFKTSSKVDGGTALFTLDSMKFL